MSVTLTTSPAVGRTIPQGWAIEGLKVQNRPNGMTEAFGHLTIDGVRVGTIEDKGDGGDCGFYPASAAGRIAYDEGLVAYLAAAEALAGEEDYPASYETLNNDLILEAEQQQVLARVLKRGKVAAVKALSEAQPEGRWDAPAFYQVPATVPLVGHGFTHTWNGVAWVAIAA